MDQLDSFQMCNQWQEFLLSDIARTSSGGTPERSIKEYYKGTIPWVKSGELNDRYIEKTGEHISEEGLRNSSAKMFARGTLLLAMYGATVGKTAILRINAATNQAVCGIEPDVTKVNSEFLRYQLIFLRKQLLSQRYGGAQPNINQTIIRNTKLRLPSVKEQYNIANILNSLQTAIEQQRNLITLTRELKNTSMHMVYSKGMRGFPQKVTEIGLIPENWEIIKFGDIADLKNGINFSSNEKGEGILTIDVLNMYGNGYYINLDNLYRVNKKIDKTNYLYQNDILFVRSSLKREGVGWTCLFGQANEPVTFCGFIIRARLKDTESLLPQFLTNYCRTDIVRKFLVSGSGQVAITNISQGILRNLYVPYPPLDEQESIVNTIDTIDKKLFLLFQSQKKFEELFTILLQKLMTGQIRVNDMVYEEMP